MDRTTRARTRGIALAAAAALLLALLPVAAATGQTAADDPEDWDAFAKTTLTHEVGEPMSMAVLPDGRVLHTNRQGQFRLYDPLTASTSVITSLPVYQFSEDGMQGIALDPDFEQNGWIYVYYSPVIEGYPDGQAPSEVEPGGDASVFDDYLRHNNLSRFRFVDDPVNPYIDLASEQVILEVEVNGGRCCHLGGDIDFDSQGNLLLATGDDTDPFQSQGYTPIDERAYRNPSFDAQRTAANTADLRGKLLRIDVQDDGSYTIPDGNLFPEDAYDADLALPEIYAMGFRNPFRFDVDLATDAIYLADYGPDASQPDPDRGPRATVEWNLITEPGNYGWPYCVGDNLPYVAYDFETGASGETFDCDAPVNRSPNNTGLEELPPAVPATVWYHNSIVTPEFPELGSGGGAPMAGPAYRYDPDLDSPTKFPEYYDGVPLFYEWSRNYVKQFHLEGDEVAEIRDFLPTASYHAPMDMEFGPDGALYLLEYGGGFFTEHPEAKLSRIDYLPDGRPPVARVSADPDSGASPLTVTFSSDGSHHPEDDAQIVSYAWSFGDGGTSAEPDPTYTYQEPGRYTATLQVEDAEGRIGRAGVTITVGNTRPTVDVLSPVDGGFFGWGDEIDYRVRVTDPEDGEIDCDEVGLSTALGHDQHAHPMGVFSGCEGSFQTPAESGHDDDMDLYWVFSARYTDHGNDGVPTLTGEDQATLHPKRRQAQHFSASSGVSTTSSTDPDEGGGTQLTGIDDGDWVSYTPVNLLNIDAIRFRVASTTGGDIELRRDAPDGELLGTASVPDTGADWTDVTLDVDDPGGTFELFLVFAAQDGGGDEDLLTLNFFEVQGAGVAGPPPAPTCEGTVAFGDRDSGVEDRPADEIRCISEVLDDGREWRNHGQFVRHVNRVVGELVADGIVTEQEGEALKRAAARSDRGRSRQR